MIYHVVIRIIVHFLKESLRYRLELSTVPKAGNLKKKGWAGVRTVAAAHKLHRVTIELSRDFRSHPARNLQK